MRAFVHLPSKRRVAGVIAFALIVFTAFTAVHHHVLGAAASAAAFTTPSEADGARMADCFVCRALVSGRELVSVVSAPHQDVQRCLEAPLTVPLPAEVFGPSAPRAPPAA